MRIIKILTISFCIILILSTSIYAIDIKDILDTGDNWTDTGSEHVNTTMNTDELKDASDQLYNLFMAIATAAALIVGVVLGIQFMTAGIEQKVEVKKSLFPYLISCVVAFGSLGIWKLLITILGEL